MQTQGIDTIILAVEQRPWCAAGLLGLQEEAISLKHRWEISGNAANMAIAGDKGKSYSR